MNIILLYGGNSLESDISEVTYLKINKLLKDSKYHTLGVYLNHEGEFFLNGKKGCFIKNKNKYYFKVNLKKHYFDFVIPLLHGKGSEDGTLKGYFDSLKIPCISASILNSSLLQDKITFKKILAYHQIKQSDFVYLTYSEYMDNDFNLNQLLDKLTFPLIVKPNSLGSSIGVKKANNLKELIISLDQAFSFDEKVLIEKCIPNLKEVNVALIGDYEEVIFSELETVSKKNDVLTYFDKYLQSKDKVTRIIPSDISLSTKEKIIKTSEEVFKLLDCFGIVRFDYLLDEKENEVYLNEINTIPGSLAYYLFTVKGINLENLFDKLITLFYKHEKNIERLSTHYKEGNKKDLLAKE